MIEIPHKKELEELCGCGKTLKELSEIYFVSIGTVDRWVRFYGINKHRCKFNKEILAKQMNIGLSKNAIARKLGCNINTLNSYLDKYNLNFKRGKIMKITVALTQEMNKLYDTNNYNMRMLADKFNLSSSTVCKYIWHPRKCGPIEKGNI